MLAITNEQGKITISFLVNDLPAQDVAEFVEFLKIEFQARQSHLSEQATLTPERADAPNSAELDKLPTRRGPLALPPLLWLALAFLPWLIAWLGSAFAVTALPRYVAAWAAVLLAIYHLLTNVVTWFEAGSAIYLALSVGLTAIGWRFFLEFANVIDYLFLSGLWFSSVPRDFAVTAEYARYRLPQAMWTQPRFKDTNMIITAAWGGYFLVAAFLTMLNATGFGALSVTVMRHLLLLPMFIFTAHFQRWYPEYLTRA